MNQPDPAAIELAQLRIALQRLALPTCGLVSLETFARDIGRAEKTLLNDLTSSNAQRRLRWPEFKKMPSGVYLATPDEIARWYRENGTSTHFDDAVSAALRRRAG